jgi:putative transposase
LKKELQEARKIVPRLSTEPIELNELERKELEHLLKRPSTPQQIALRVKIVLRADKQESHGEIARELGITKKMSRLWRQRWRELTARQLPVLERLLDIPRPGSPGRFSMEQITQLYALACEPPEKYNRPLSHWSARELALEMIQQGIVETISERHVGRLLQEAEFVRSGLPTMERTQAADLKPHQNGYWLHPPPTIFSNSKSKTSALSMN